MLTSAPCGGSLPFAVSSGDPLPISSVHWSALPVGGGGGGACLFGLAYCCPSLEPPAPDSFLLMLDWIYSKYRKGERNYERNTNPSSYTLSGGTPMLTSHTWLTTHMCCQNRVRSQLVTPWRSHVEWIFLVGLVMDMEKLIGDSDWRERAEKTELNCLETQWTNHWAMTQPAFPLLSYTVCGRLAFAWGSWLSG